MVLNMDKEARTYCCWLEDGRTTLRYFSHTENAKMKYEILSRNRDKSTEIDPCSTGIRISIGSL